MIIFLTGTNGFLGQALAERLLNNQHEVHGLILEKTCKVKGVIPHKCDLLNFKKIGKILKEVNPDMIIHLAARTEVEKSFYDPIEFSMVNYGGTVNLIEKSKNLPNLKLFIFASTMETYGEVYTKERVLNQTEIFLPFDEDTPQKPNAPYAVAKVGCEYYLKYTGRTQNFPYVILRQTNTYGRYDNDFFVVEQMITQMLKQMKKKDPAKRIVKFGYKDPYRNFLFVDDLMNLYETIIANPEKARGQIFCCGPNNALTMKNLAKKIAEKIGYDGQIFWDTKRKRVGEIYYLNSVATKVQEVLGWSPKTTLDEGLDLTIKLWRNNLKIYERDNNSDKENSALHEVQPASPDNAAETSTAQ